MTVLTVLVLVIPNHWSMVIVAESVCDCRDCTKVKPKDCPSKKGSCKLPNYKNDGNCDDENVRKNKWCHSDACMCCKIFLYIECSPGHDVRIFHHLLHVRVGLQNNCQCDWDGGACCAKSNGGSVSTKYCKVSKTPEYVAPSCAHALYQLF